MEKLKSILIVEKFRLYEFAEHIKIGSTELFEEIAWLMHLKLLDVLKQISPFNKAKKKKKTSDENCWSQHAIRDRTKIQVWIELQNKAKFIKPR